MSLQDIRFLGIRHHGPGSARRLLRFLEDWQPDLLLLEAPAEALPLLSWVGHVGLIPPVALLLYHPQDLQHSQLLPFASFSPEWLAISWANGAGVPVRTIDLPAAHSLVLPREKVGEADGYSRDPMARVAALAGYADSERWWEHAFEHLATEAEWFDRLGELMIEVRGQQDRQESEETLIREAWMRLAIRKAAKEVNGKIAVVCGAWHVPELALWEQVPSARDKERLPPAAKLKITGTWIPWTYERLARQSGYGAGVLSPAWYDMLFSHRQDAGLVWLSAMAASLRKEGYAVSPAHLQAVLALADHLSGLRQRPNAGLEEMEAALEAVLPVPPDILRAQIQSRWIIGEKTGSVPAEVPQTPLQADLFRQIASARLKNEFDSGRPIRKQLDLRTPTNRIASRLLHQLNILAIPWGQPEASPETARGDFHEHWRLHWKPLFLLEVIDRGMWGNTIASAAAKKMGAEIGQAGEVLGLVRLLQQAIHAGLAEQVDLLSERLRFVALDALEMSSLLASVPVLIRLLRYPGYRLDCPLKIAGWLDILLPRLCTNLPAASETLAEEPARELAEQVAEVHTALCLLQESNLLEMWENALLRLASGEAIHPRLEGLALRFLLERDRLVMPFILTRMTRVFSKGQNPMDAGQWLEGFLHRGVYLIGHHTGLFALLDDWVAGLSADQFQEVLPVLRRTFAPLDGSAREEIWQRAQHGEMPMEQTTHPLRMNDNNLREFLPLFRKILLGKD